MREFYKPRIFISSCLEKEKCRYDGGIIHDEFVKKLLDFIDVFRVCPEMSIGLGAPREALRMVKRKNEPVKLLSSLVGNDYTSQINEFSDKYLTQIKDDIVDGFILKAKSPTCGISNVKIYRNIGKANVLSANNMGFFGAKVNEYYPNYPIETERRLSNYKIRDRFYTEIFALAEFRNIKANLRLKDLIDYHSKNKYLFMCFNQNVLKELGRIVANSDKLLKQELFDKYEATLRQLLSKTPTQKNRINVLTHIYGYFKKLVTTKEKEYYFDLLDDYLRNQKNFSSLLVLLESWTIRFNQAYLINQTIFQPYPKPLITMLDSGKQL